MDHIAIMKKSWKLLPKILDGTKKIESRWYKIKACPWDRVKKGDTLYFKDSGAPVTIKSKVNRVAQYGVESNEEAREILRKHKNQLGIEEVPDKVSDYVKDKKYAILVFFDSVEMINPFDIDKTGFGVQAAWLTVKNIEDIKL